MDARALTPHEGTLLEELGWVRTLASRLVADANDADDLVQEAWLKAQGTPPERFASRSFLRAWLASVTRRMARDARRSRLRRARREERAARSETLGSPEDVVERSALLEALLHSVRQLDEPYRSTVLLRYMDARSTAEVAAALSVSEEVVRKRLSRALARLRTGLAREWGGALPQGLEQALGAASSDAAPAPRAPSHPSSHGFVTGIGASLGLLILTLFASRAFQAPALQHETHAAPELRPAALDTPSLPGGSGAVSPLAPAPLEPAPVLAEAAPAVEPATLEARPEPEGASSAVDARDDAPPARARMVGAPAGDP
jgi:RNA polymerase sigma-70 factor (ECF subfamily)